MTGRPSLYTDELADEICARLADGQSLRKICEADEMPDRRTVMRWQGEKPAFETKCARARVLQADYMDDLILDTANESKPETAAADRVKIGAYQWRAARLAPKRYGDKLQHVGDGGGPVNYRNLDELTLEELEQLDQLSAKLSGGGVRPPAEVGDSSGDREEAGEG